MSKRAAVFVANGTEPVEATAPIDILRRGGIDVDVVSAMLGTDVGLAHGIDMNADILESEFNPDQYDAVVVPGGSVGVENLGNSEVLANTLKKFMAEGKHVASICAGPTILADLGLLDGYKATCYPGCEKNFPAGCYQNVHGVVEDRNLITASGPGQALDFGAAILRALAGDSVADGVKSGMLF